MVKSTITNHFGRQQTTGDGNPKFKFPQQAEWIELTQEPKEQLILNDIPFHSSRQASMNEVNNSVSLEYMSEFTAMKHDVTQQDDTEPKDGIRMNMN
jgi:hypothetical protein